MARRLVLLAVAMLLMGMRGLADPFLCPLSCLLDTYPLLIKGLFEGRYARVGGYVKEVVPFGDGDYYVYFQTDDPNQGGYVFRNMGRSQSPECSLDMPLGKRFDYIHVIGSGGSFYFTSPCLDWDDLSTGRSLNTSWRPSIGN